MLTSWFATCQQACTMRGRRIESTCCTCRDVRELPSERTTPSEPVMNCSGLPGIVTMACWSGISPHGGSASCVRSLNVAAIGRQQPGASVRGTLRSPHRRTSRRGDDVGRSGWRDDVVVPALPGAVTDGLKRRQSKPEPPPRGIVSTIEPGPVPARVGLIADADVHSRLSVG